MTGGRSLHFLRHWYGRDPPTTIDLDTEILIETLRFTCVFENRKFKKSIVTWAGNTTLNYFILFLRSILGATVALQAGNKNRRLCFGLIPFLSYFSPSLANNYNTK